MPIKKKRPSLTLKKRATRKRITPITIDEPLLARIDERWDNRSEAIRTDLGRYYRLLAEARATLREILTPDELAAIVDVQNGHWYQGRLDGSEIWANVEDGCRLEGLADKWSIDGPALVTKLRGLDLLAVHALADATQRFWHAVGAGDERRDPRRALD